MTDRPRRSSLGLVAAILVAGLAVALLLVWWVRRERAAQLEQWRNRLSATAEDRRAGVDAWIEERLGDALVAAQFPSTPPLLDRRVHLSRALSERSQEAAHLQDVLDRLRGDHLYRAIWIVDASGGVAASSGSLEIDSPCLAIALKAQAYRKPLVAFHERSDGAVVVGAAAPVLAPAGRPLGAVLMEIDPTRDVYPMLTTEPAPSRSGETLLVKQEGADLVFLSPLRHGREGRRRARWPLAPPGLAVVASPSGVESLEFVDYRGVRVLAATRGLRNAPWAIVTKIDAAEAFEAYHQELWQSAVVVAGLLLAVAGVAFGLWRQRTASARLALARSEARFGLLLEQAADAILFVRPDGRIANVNRRAEELYGYRRSELLGMHINDLAPPQGGANRAATDVGMRMAAGRHGSGRVFEERHLARDGRFVPVEVSGRLVELDGESLFLAIVRDVRERKAAEKRIALLNRLLRTLSEVDRAMARESDPERLASEACRILVAHGGFSMAWIGLGDPATGQVVPAAWSGHDDGYLSEAVVGKDETPLRHGPVWTSLHEGRTVVVTDVLTDELFAPWREAARRRGYRSLAATPVPTSGGTPTVLALYAAEPGVFEAEVVEVVEELAGDIGFALRSIAADRERTQALEDLRSSQAFLAALINASPIAIFTLGLDGRVGQIWNPAAEEMLGWSRAEAIGRPAGFVPPEREEESRALRQLVVEGRSLSNVEMTRRRRDGTSIDVVVAAAPLHDVDGRVVELLAMVADISERKRMEAALRESEDRFKRLAENAPDVIYRLRLWPTPAVEYVNRAVEVIGHSPEEFLADPGLLPRLIHPGDRHVMEATFRGELSAMQPSRIRWVRDDGSIVWTEIHSAAVRDPEGRVVAVEGISRDVTERVAAEEILRETREQLLQSQRLEAVGRLAGGVAHDFNNILGVVLGHTELLLRRLQAGDENRPRLEQILAAARRAADLTRQLLAFSRRQVLRAQVVDLNAVVMDTREILERLIGEDIALGTRLEPDLGRVEVDPGQIGQVLMNLALNARDAMPDGGTLAIETANATLDEATPGEPDSLPPGSYVRLRVCDTGAGIDERVRPHIFEPFFTTKAPGLGSGLGLSTVYGIVTQSGGAIQVDSSPGQGTAFTIHLPRLEEAAAVLSASPAEEAPRGGPETILVVEDQDELRSLICEVLGDAGHTVLAAANGLEALARAESHAGAVELLLTDVVMPGMNGRELAERLTALRPGLRVLFVSGYARDVIAKRGVLEEQVELLEKPFSRAGLLRRVRRVLDGRG